jgi:hypothetical protein
MDDDFDIDPIEQTSLGRTALNMGLVLSGIAVTVVLTSPGHWYWKLPLSVVAYIGTYLISNFGVMFVIALPEGLEAWRKRRQSQILA